MSNSEFRGETRRGSVGGLAERKPKVNNIFERKDGRSKYS